MKDIRRTCIITVSYILGNINFNLCYLISIIIVYHSSQKKKKKKHYSIPQMTKHTTNISR